MTRPKNKVFLGLAILAVMAMFMIATSAQNCNSVTNFNANSQYLPSVNFTTVGSPYASTPNLLPYATTPGVDFDAAGGFQIKPLAGSAAAITFVNKINLRSGVSLNFQYSSPWVTSSGHAGFAVMFQNDRADQRDGANEHLGYRVNGALAIEFDYFTNPSTTDCANSPHIQISVPTSKTAQTSFACPSNTALYKRFTPQANTPFDVTITITKNTGGSTHDISVTVKKVSDSSSIVAFSATNLNIAPAFDDNGGSWIGFTSSATDAAQPQPFSISNVKLNTAGVGVPQPGTPTPIPSSVGVTATGKQSLATSGFDQPGAFSFPFTILDKCGAMITSLTEEVNPANLQFSFNNISTLNCAVGPFTSTTTSSSISWLAQIGCRKITTSTPPIDIVLSTVKEFPTNLPPVFNTAVTAYGITIIAGPAIARQSFIDKITVVGGSQLCATKDTCAGTSGTGSSTTPFTTQSGQKLNISVTLFDQFDNPVAASTTLTVALSPTPGSTSTTLTPTSNSGTQTSQAVVTFEPKNVTPAAPSILSVTVQSQALTISKPYFAIQPGTISATSTAVTGGLGFPKYVAGQSYTFQVLLKDVNGNIVTGFDQNSAIVSPNPPLVFKLQLTSNTNVCSSGNQATVGFSDGCPVAVVNQQKDGFISFTATPTTADSYTLICTVGGSPCAQFSASGLSLVVVAADEQIQRTALEPVVTSDISLVRYSSFSVPSSPTTLTKSNFEFGLTPGTAFTDAVYFTAGTRKSFLIRSQDRYGNKRSNSANVGLPYQIRVYHGNNGLQGAFDAINCGTTATPPVAYAADGGVTSNIVNILDTSQCVYNSASGYQVDLVMKTASYYGTVSSAAYHIVVAQGTSTSQNLYSALVQTAFPTSAAITSTPQQADRFSTGNTPQTPALFTAWAVAGQFVKYSVVLSDAYGNKVQPLGAVGRDGTYGVFPSIPKRNVGDAITITNFAYPAVQKDLDFNQQFFQVSHSVAGSQAQPTVALPILNAANYPDIQTNRHLFIYESERWSTVFYFKSAYPTTPTVHFRTLNSKLSTPISVAPGVFVEDSTKITTSYTQSTDATPVGTWFNEWVPIDENANPTWLASTTPALSSTENPNPTSNTVTAATSAPVPAYANNWTESWEDAYQSAGTGYKLKSQKFTGTLKKSIDSVSGIISTIKFIGTTKSTTVTWPSTVVVTAVATVFYSRTAVTIPDTPAANYQPGTPWTSNATPYTPTAGDYVIIRFAPASPNDDALTASLATVNFSDNYVAVGSPVTRQKSVFLTYRLTQASSTEITLTPVYSASNRPVTPKFTVSPAAVSLDNSDIEVPPSMTVCADPLAADLPATNIVKITPRDQFNNAIKPTAQLPVTLEAGALQVAPLVPTATALSFALCTQTAQLITFSIKGPSSQEQLQLTVFSPGAISSFVLEPNQNDCTVGAGATTASSCALCTLGSPCAVRIQARDSFGNTIQLTDADRAKLLFTTSATFSYPNDSNKTTKCTLAEVNNARSVTANLFATATATPEASTGPSNPSTLSGDSIVVTIPSNAFQFPSLAYIPSLSTACGHYKSLVVTYDNSQTKFSFPIVLAPSPSPSRYSIRLNSLMTAPKYSAASGLIDLTSPAIPSSVVGTKMSFNFVDASWNNWYYQTVESQLTGTLRPATAGLQSIPLATSVGVENYLVITNPVFSKAATFSLDTLVFGGTVLPGFEVKVVAGPISRWDFTFPHYGQERPASATITGSDDSTIQWTVNATPYDVHGNLVSTAEAVTSAKALKLIVFEGATVCDTSATQMYPTSTGSTGSREIAASEHGFVINKATQTQATGVIVLLLTSTRANSLSPSGSRATYTYYFGPSSTRSVYTCNGATINIVPAAADPNKSTVAFADGGSAIQRGDLANFAVTLRDIYSNVISYESPTDSNRIFALKACEGDAAIACDDKTTTATCTIQPAENYSQAQFTTSSLIFAISYTSPSSGPEVLINNPKLAANREGTCFVLTSHHAAPIDVFFVSPNFLNPAPAVDATAWKNLSAMPFTSATRTSLPNPISVDTLTGAPFIQMRAGVPQTFQLVSRDFTQQPINYNDPAFNNFANRTSFLGKIINDFVYEVTARFTRDLYTVDAASSSATSELNYFTTQYSTVIITDADFEADSSPKPVYHQHVTLLPQWPGYYTLSVRAVRRSKPSVEVTTNIGSGRITLVQDINLLAVSPICTTGQVYSPAIAAIDTSNPYALEPQNFGSCPVASDTRFFTCVNSQGSDVQVTVKDYTLVNGCACRTDKYTLCGDRCVTKNPNALEDMSDEDYCLSLKLVETTPRVCPADYFLCSDRLTCVVDSSSCDEVSRLPECTGQHLCSDGSCARNEALCPTPIACPSGEFLCPSGQCVASGENCSQLRECNDEGLFRCPIGDACVSSLGQCPTTAVCPDGFIKCSTGFCATDIAQCTGPESGVDDKCPLNRPFRCQDRSCTVDASFCPSGLSCGTVTPFLCPDKKTCVAAVTSCNVVQSCPEGTTLCSSGDCLPAAKCPTSATCPTSTPVLCINGSCVETKAGCNEVDIDFQPCPASAPVRCGAGNCAKDAALCATLIQCPFFKPIMCATGECVSALEECPSTTPSCGNDIKCPISGACAKYAHWCPTIRACRDDEIRCSNGQCYPYDPALTDSCPLHARNPMQCAAGTVQCPLTNTGIMCRQSIKDCPTDVICPSTAPFRCESSQCAASPDDCAWASALDTPDTRVACGMGTWAPSVAICGTPPTCPSTQPVLCLDGSCRAVPGDCPEAHECPPNLPFKCASGDCQLNSYSCSISRCTDPLAQVRCPSHDALGRCVAHIDLCPDVTDLVQAATIATPCVFTARCWDGTCVNESRLCPARSCPPQSPFLCVNGGCARTEELCQTEAGCPFDLPFFCKYSASCVKDEGSCAQGSDKITGALVECPSTITTDPTTGEQTSTPSTLVLCDDGSCRASADDCLKTGPFGCPPETPLRCADGSCVAKPTDSNPVPLCRVASDLYNACPASRPVRCPGGMCATSTTRCPSFPALISATQTNGICREVKRKVADPKDEKKQIEITEYMTVTCDDGSCAFSHAECPIIKPCKNTEFRCGDGSCRYAGCDLTQASCRNGGTSDPISIDKKDFMGAECPLVNTCPGQLPYRCQSGECAIDRTQCLSNFPITLGSCCGSSSSFSLGKINPQGEDVGQCSPVSKCEDNGNYTTEALTNKGCPKGMYRCSRGQCVPSGASQDELCSVYEQAFDQLANQVQTCAVRCPSTGLCVDDITACTNASGCKLSTPFLCDEGNCVAQASECSASTTCALKCPTTGRCVTSLLECTTPLGCPLDKPILCADGTCKAEPASQKDLTVAPYPTYTPIGIAEDVCKPTISCGAFDPFLCADGTCQPSLDLCAPVLSQCSGVCRFACPLTNQCTQLQSLNINGVTMCDYDSLIEQCQIQEETCPQVRPFLCPSGQCVALPTDCSSPVFNSAQTLNCPVARPFRCVDGGCAARPYDCIIATASVLQTTPAITPTTQITNTNVCTAGYVCPDGLCVQDSSDCSPVPACQPGALRCVDGSCAAPTVNGNTIVAPVCPPLTDFEASCSGGTRCDDGTCRSVGSCPRVLGCGIDKIACPWNLKSRCVDTAEECPGYFPSSGSMVISSIPASSRSTPAQSLRIGQVQTAFPHLSNQSVEEMVHLANAMDRTIASRFITLQTGGSFAPQTDLVETCYSNCERDIPATQSTTVVTPLQSIRNLAVSSNQYSIPRTSISIPAGSVNRTAEFSVYSTPETLFDGANAQTLGYALPFTWEEPKKRSKENMGTAGEFATKVISTPFSCSLTVNNTAITPALAMSVTSYVDTKAYAVTRQGTETTQAQFPCAYLGKFDSALIGSGCGGSTYISGATMEMNYTQSECQWAATADVLQFKASLTKILTADTVVDTVEWNGQTARQVICMRIDQSTRRFADGTSVVGSEFCATFSRITDLIQITLPDNFMVYPPSYASQADQTGVPAASDNMLTAADLTASLTSPPTDTVLQTLSNTLFYDPTAATTTSCSTTSSDVSQIAKQDICLGYYDYATLSWSCINPLNEQRLAAPTWTTGMKLNQATAALPNCDKNAYAFLYVPLPDPVPVEDNFCFWCKYGWIILLVCIIFVVVLIIVIFFALKFYHDRIKYKAEQKKLKGLQEHAQDLAENQGGLGVADADGEINMTVNPLVLQLQDLNKQLEEANVKLDTIGKEEEYHIQRLQQQRQRIQAEIKNLEASLAHDETVKLAPKRVDAPTAGPSSGSGVPQGPVRTGGAGPSGPSAVGAASGPMRAPPK